MLDPDDWVLLFRYDDGLPNGRHLATPGGGLDDGETYAAGARRELAEETGWSDVPLSGEIYRWTRAFDEGGETYRSMSGFSWAGSERPAGRSVRWRRRTPGPDCGVALVDAGGNGRHRGSDLAAGAGRPDPAAPRVTQGRSARRVGRVGPE